MVVNQHLWPLVTNFKVYKDTDYLTHSVVQMQIRVTGSSEYIDVPAKLGSLASLLRSQTHKVVECLEGRAKTEREAEERERIKVSITSAIKAAQG